MSLFASRGFYLHASWSFNYPFAVRTWELGDYVRMFKLLRALDFNRVMIWPMSELCPEPLQAEDAQRLTDFCQVVEAAREHGLECWLVFCPCLSTVPEIARTPYAERVFYRNSRTFRLDDEAQFDAYLQHLKAILTCLNNADGYVFIDGDPGGYPGALPEDYLALLHALRPSLQASAKLIPWIWSGWGADWEGEGPWKPDLRALVRPFLDAWQANPPPGPVELLPGRSYRDGHANGRINFELTEEADLLGQSTLLTYEIIEFEPTPPAFVVQFGNIRRVLSEEFRLAGEVRGIMGNAQQPIAAIHNLFYYSRCLADPQWLSRSDNEILAAYADFLGGDSALLSPAIDCLRRNTLAADLPARLRATTLTSESAQLLPGGPTAYLESLAIFVEARLAVIHCLQTESPEAFDQAVSAILAWWQHHRYTCTGGFDDPYTWGYTHSALRQPLLDWAAKHSDTITVPFLGA